MRLGHIAFLAAFVLVGMIFAGKLRGLPGLSMLPQY